MKCGTLRAAAVLLCGCQAEPANPPTQKTRTVVPERSAQPAPPAVATLEGEWRVAGVDGQPLDEPIGLALRASKDEIWWAPRCAQFVRSYSIAGTRLTIGPAQWLRSRPPADVPPPCAIGLPPRLRDVARALDSAVQVGRTPENGVLISGGGHSLLLFSQ